MAGPQSGGTAVSSFADPSVTIRRAPGKGLTSATTSLSASAPVFSSSSPPSAPVSSPAPLATSPVPSSAAPSVQAPRRLSPAEVKVKEFFHKNKVESLYDSVQVSWIRDNLVDLVERSDAAIPESYEAHFERLEDVFRERKTLLRHEINVRRKEIEIRRAELRTGELPPEEGGITAYARQMATNLPYEGMVPHGREGVYVGYGDEVPGTTSGDHSGAFYGGTEEELMSIREGDEPVIHIKPVSSNYRNNVFDALSFVRDDQRANNLRLRTILREGRDITAEEDKSVRRVNMYSHRASNLAESFTKVVNNIVGAAGKGIISKTDHREDPRYLKYLKKRSELISNLLWRFDPKERTAYLEALNKFDDMLGGADLLDEATFSRMQKLIEERMKEEGRASEAEISSFNDRLNKINKEMLEDIEGMVSKEDDAFKWRVLQIFLIITPFSAFSVAGEVLNWVDLLGIFDPLLDPSLSFGEALAEVGTSEMLGPFGFLADFLGLDEMVKFLFDEVPIVNEVFNGIKELLIDNSVSQELFGIAAPMMGSPMLFLFGAGAAAFMGADDIIKHGEENRALKKKHNEKLEQLFKDFEEHSELTTEDRCKELVERRSEEFALMYLETEFLKFITSATEKDLEIFAGQEFSCEGENVTIADLRKKYPSDERFKEAIVEGLFDRSRGGMLKSCIDSFLVYESSGREEKDYNDVKAVPARFSVEASKMRDKFNKKFIIEYSERISIAPGESLGSDLGLAVENAEKYIEGKLKDGEEIDENKRKEIVMNYCKKEERKTDFERALRDLDRTDLSKEHAEKLAEFLHDLEYKLKSKDYEFILTSASRGRDSPNPSVARPDASSLHGGKDLFGSGRGSPVVA